MLYCSRWVRVQSSKEGSLWSWDSAAGPGPLRERVDFIMQGQESSPDFIPRKDFRKLVQPTVFGQWSCLLLCFMYKTAEAQKGDLHKITQILSNRGKTKIQIFRFQFGGLSLCIKWKNSPSAQNIRLTSTSPQHASIP